MAVEWTQAARWGHGHLRSFLDQRVRDGVLRRTIDKWLKAGVMEDGAVRIPDSGSPQGGVISSMVKRPAASAPTVLERAKSLEHNGTPVVYVFPDGSTYVEGHGYRVAIVIAGEDSYRPTGTWTYTGMPGETMPWFWRVDAAPHGG